MTRTSEARQAAVMAVAREACATWEPASGVWPDAWLITAAGRIAVEVAAVPPDDAGPATRPRLRFDKVVQRLVADLTAALTPILPEGRGAVITVTAPIRLAGKTAAALVEAVRGRLADPSPARDFTDTLLGNKVHVRLVDGVSDRAPRVISLVHNPEPGAVRLLDLGEALVLALRARPPGLAGPGRLVIADPDERLPIAAWRQVCVQLSPFMALEAIWVARGGGGAEPLAS